MPLENSSVGYPFGSSAHDAEVRGPFRTVQFDGRSGLLAESVHSRLSIPRHTVDAPAGSLTWWVASRDDLRSWSRVPWAAEREPHYDEFVLLADAGIEAGKPVQDAAGTKCIGPLRDFAGATFALAWMASWYPQFIAKWAKGPVYGGDQSIYSHEPPWSKACVAAGHWHVHAGHWYQIGLTWDKASGDYRLYLNGVLLSVSNRFSDNPAEPVAGALVAGNTTFILSDIEFYDRVISPEEIAERYAAEATAPDEGIDSDLRRIYAAEGVESFAFEPGTEWTPELELGLCDRADLDHFVVQGYDDDVIHPEPEGLRIATHNVFRKSAEGLQQSQGYLWTRRSFEGDCYLEFEFMPLRENGLSLLCLQTAGMQGEDFMADYPRRLDGSMSLVYNENVRLYHWEYFREMDDTRNDVASSALIKEPWQHPLAYQCLKERLVMDRWHRLQFLQEGTRLRGALDGQVVFDVQDDPFGGHGPALRNGRIAIRLMWKTEMRFRNLRILGKTM